MEADVYYCIHIILLLTPIHSQMNQIQMLQPIF
jgi:hypothetical protein